MTLRNKNSSNLFEILLSLILVRFIILALVLANVIPRQEISEKVKSQDRGLMRIEILWPSGSNIDIDLWMKPPSSSPVGWSNKSTENADLVRDDLGNSDENPARYEIIYVRNLIPGKYLINVHMFANRDLNKYPSVPIKCIITKSNSDESKSDRKDVYKREVTLTQLGEEQTIVSFVVNNEKEIITESISTIYEPIFKVRR